MCRRNLPMTLEKRQKREAYRRRKAERRQNAAWYGNRNLAGVQEKDGMFKRVAGAISRFFQCRWF